MKNVFLFIPVTALLLAACGGTPAPVGSAPVPTPAPAVLSAINGAVQNHSGGASTIKLLASGDYTLPESSSNPALASAALSAAGGFNLTLPSLATIAPYLSESGTGAAPSATCSGGISVSDPTAKGYAFSDLHVGNVVFYNGSFTSTSASITVNNAAWVYLDRLTTLSGTYRCTDTTTPGETDISTQNYNAPLKQGWNILDQSSTFSGSADGTTVTSVTNYTTGSDRATVWTALQNPAPSAQATTVNSLTLRVLRLPSRLNLFGNTLR